MKIFLAGASSAIGRPLTGLLVAHGHDVAGTTRDAAKAPQIADLGAKPVVVDVYDRDGLAAAFRAERPDVVIDQLTDMSRLDFAATNRLRVEGTRNLVDAASAVGVRRMVTQSLAGAYAPGRELATEGSPLYLDAPEPWAGVVQAVAIMEQIVAEIPESVILRYGLFYGPGTRFDVDGSQAEAVWRGSLRANENVTSFIHIEDAARAALLALDWPAGTYNIVDDEPMPASTWVPRFVKALGGTAPSPVPGRTPILSRGVSNQKARHDRGWAPLHPSWHTGPYSVPGVAASA
jgi:nucleoside-diphosphate-sugar epimerase